MKEISDIEVIARLKTLSNAELVKELDAAKKLARPWNQFGKVRTLVLKEMGARCADDYMGEK